MPIASVVDRSKPQGLIRRHFQAMRLASHQSASMQRPSCSYSCGVYLSNRGVQIMPSGAIHILSELSRPTYSQELEKVILITLDGTRSSDMPAVTITMSEQVDWC